MTRRYLTHKEAYALADLGVDVRCWAVLDAMPLEMADTTNGWSIDDGRSHMALVRMWVDEED